MARIKLVLFASLFSSFIHFLSAQNAQTDSLGHELTKELDDTVRIHTMGKLAWTFVFNNPDTAISIIDDAITLSRKVDWQEGLANSLKVKGIGHSIKSEFSESLQAYEEGLAIHESMNDSDKIAASHVNIGLLYSNMSDFTKALSHYFTGLKIAEQIQHDGLKSMLYGNIGIIYSRLIKDDEALDYYFKGVEIDEKLDRQNGLASKYINIGLIYERQEKFDEAIKYYKRAIDIKEKTGDLRGVAIATVNLGTTYLTMRQYAEAEKYSLKALEVEKQVKSKSNIARAYNVLGKLYLEQNQLHKAKKFLDKGYAEIEGIGDLEQSEQLHKNFSAYYEAVQDYKNALFHFKSYSQVKDSIYNDEKSKEIGRLEAGYEHEKEQAIKEAEHQAQLEKQEAIAQKEREQQNTVIVAVSSGFVLVVLFALFIFNRFRITKRQKGIIEEQKTVVELQKDLVEEKNKEITDSINYAKRIQEAILPSRYSLAEKLKNGFILFKPKDVVSGDFYWMEESVGKRQKAVVGNNEMSRSDSDQPSEVSMENTIYLAAADCTGHGVPGAMVSVICSNALSKSLLEEHITEPAKILDRTRELVIEQFKKSEEEVKDGMDISLAALAHSEKSENGEREVQLQWSGANNPFWIVSKREHIYEGVKRVVEQNGYYLHEVSADKQPIGKYADPKPFTNHRLNLQKGETIYMFSDGFPDQFGGERGKKFKAANFKKLLLSIQEQTMEEQKAFINQTFEDWKACPNPEGGAQEFEQIDDVCVIGVRVSAL